MAAASPYGSSVRPSRQPAAGRGGRFPAIRRAPSQSQLQQPWQSVMTAGHDFGSSGASTRDQPQPMEWLTSPRTQRMLELLGVRPTTGPDHPNQPAAAHPATTAAYSRHPLPSGLTDPPGQAFAQTYQHQQQQQPSHHQHSSSALSYTTPLDHLSPHPPSDAKRAPPGYDPTGYEAKEPIPSDPHQQYQQQQPQPQRMFMPAGGVRRYYRAQQHQSVHPHKRKASTTYPLHPIGPTGSPRTVASQPPPEPLLTPERQLVVDFLTGPTCSLFKPMEQPEEEEDEATDPFGAPPTPDVSLTDEHLSALLALPGCSDGLSLVRALRSLEKLHLSFHTTGDLIASLEGVLARKQRLLDWLLSHDCRLFGQSPFVMFLNVAAIDRLVEEAGLVRLAEVQKLMGQPNADEAEESTPEPTQAYDDAWHVLARLNESGREVHYFSALIAMVKEVVDQALRDAGVEVRPDESATAPTPNRADSHSPGRRSTKSLRRPSKRRPGHNVPALFSESASSAFAYRDAPTAAAAAPLEGTGEEKQELTATPTTTTATAPTTSQTNSSRRPPRKDERERDPQLLEESVSPPRQAAPGRNRPSANYPAATATTEGRHGKQIKKAVLPQGGAKASATVSASAAAAASASSREHLRALVVQKLSTRSCKLIPTFLAQLEGALAQQTNQQVDALVRCLSQLTHPSVALAHSASASSSSTSVGGLPQPSSPFFSDVLALARLQQIEDSSHGSFGTVAELTEALREQEAASASSSSLVEQDLVGTSPKKPSIYAAAPPSPPSSSIARIPGDIDPTLSQSTIANNAAAQILMDDLSPRSYEDKRRHMAIIAFLSQAGLITPRLDAHELFRQVFAHPAHADTFDALRRVERDQTGPFVSYQELLEHVKDRQIETIDDLRELVREMLSLDSCGLLPCAPTLEEVEHLIDDGGAMYSTLKHLRTLDREGRQYDEVDELADALKVKHDQAVAARKARFAAAAEEDKVNPLDALEVERLDAIDIEPIELERSDAFTFGVKQPPLPGWNSNVPKSAAGGMKQAQVEPQQQSVLDQQPEPEVEEQTIMMRRASTPSRSSNQAPSVLDSFSAKPTTSPITVDVDELEDHPDGLAEDDTLRLRSLRRAIYTYVHSAECRLLPREYTWTDEAIEHLVDDLGPWEDQHSMVGLLQAENARLAREGLGAYRSVAALTEELHAQRYAPLTAAMEKHEAATRAAALAPYHATAEELLSVLHYLGQPDVSLLPRHIAQHLAQPDAEWLTRVGGADTVLFLFELSDQATSRPSNASSASSASPSHGRAAFASLEDLREAVRRQRSQALDVHLAWLRVLAEHLRSHPATLTTRADPADLEGLLRVAAHPPTVLLALERVAGRQFTTFAELQAAVRAELDEEQQREAAVLAFLQQNMSAAPTAAGAASERFFTRSEVVVDAPAVRQLFAYTHGDASAGMLAYLRTMVATVQQLGPFTHWTAMIRFVRGLHATASADAGSTTSTSSTGGDEEDPSSSFRQLHALPFDLAHSGEFDGLTSCSRRLAQNRAQSKMQRAVEQRARRADVHARVRAARKWTLDRMELGLGSLEVTPGEKELAALIVAVRTEQSYVASPPIGLWPEALAGFSPRSTYHTVATPRSTRASNGDGSFMVMGGSAVEQAQRLQPTSPWWDASETPKQRYDRIAPRMHAARRDRTADELDALLQDAKRCGRFDARWRIRQAREIDHARECREQGHVEVSAGVRQMSSVVELVSAITVVPSSLSFSSQLPRHNITVTSRELDLIFLVKLEASNAAYSIAGVGGNPAYLHPGQSLTFALENSCQTRMAQLDASISLLVRAVLASETEHFSSAELWRMNEHRVTQMQAVCICTGDGTRKTLPPKRRTKVDADRRVSTGVTAAAASAAVTPVAVAAAPSVASPSPLPSSVAPSPAAPSARRMQSRRSGADVPMPPMPKAIVIAPFLVPEPTSDSPMVTQSVPTALLMDTDLSGGASIDIMHIPVMASEEELAATAAKRRAKRQTQAVDMGAIRASGVLLKKGDATAPPATATTATPSTASASSASPPIVVTSLSGPVAIAVADSEYARMDGTAKKRNKRMTQVTGYTGNLAEHVMLAKQVKQAAAAAAGPSSSSSSAAASSARTVPEPIAMPLTPPMRSSLVSHDPSSPLAIAKMDDAMAQISAADKRKAKRATQAVDPLLAAKLMQRVLASKPAEAQTTVSAAKHSAVVVAPADAATHSPIPVDYPVLTAASSSSPVAIAGAKQQTRITQALPDNVEDGNDAASQRGMSRAMSLRRSGGGVSPDSADPVVPPSTTSSDIPTVINPSGALAVAVADGQVAAMSSREKRRGKRMTQALFDSSYDQETAKTQRPVDLKDEEKREAATAAAAGGVSSSAQPIAPPADPVKPVAERRVEDITSIFRTAPRLALAISECRKAEFVHSAKFDQWRTGDPLRRVIDERLHDHESFPKKSTFPQPPPGPISYFVDSLGTLEISPPSLILHPSQPLPIAVHNRGDFTVCVFALASDEEFVLHTPTPEYILPGQCLFLHVSCESQHAPPCAEIGLVFKPILSSEDGAATASQVWERYPHRVMQRVHVPVKCVTRVPRPASGRQGWTTVTVGTASGSNQFLQPRPPSRGGGPGASRRNQTTRSNRISGTDFTYPGAGGATPAGGTATPKLESTPEKEEAKPPATTTSASSATLAGAGDSTAQLQRLDSAALSGWTDARADRFDRYRHDATSRVVNARHAEYPAYVHFVPATQQEYAAAATEVGDAVAAVSPPDQPAMAHFQAVSVPRQITTQPPPDERPHTSQQRQAFEEKKKQALSPETERRLLAKMSTVTPQQRMAAYRAHVRMDAETRIVDLRHAEYPPASIF